MFCSRYYFDKFIPCSWDDSKLRKHNTKTSSNVVKKSFRGLLQFTKVKKGSSDLWNKQGSSFENVDVLKNSEKVPHSKSSFYNQLIKCSLFLVSLWPVINTEERTRIASPGVAALNSLNLIYIGGVQICGPLFCEPVFP